MAINLRLNDCVADRIWLAVPNRPKGKASEGRVLGSTRHVVIRPLHARADALTTRLESIASGPVVRKLRIPTVTTSGHEEEQTQNDKCGNQTLDGR
jgi:hypothetical protein